MRGWLALSAALLAHPMFLPETARAVQPSEACRSACAADQSHSQPALRQCLSRCAAGKPLTPGAPSPAQPAPVASIISAPTPAVTYGAVYLATPPNMGYGMVVGQPDRLTAHRLAEFACRARGASCLMARDFTLPCAAVVEGVRRAPGALFMTSDPHTYRVRAITFAVASNPADAERDARETCARRERGELTCRIVKAQCGPR